MVFFTNTFIFTDHLCRQYPFTVNLYVQQISF